MNITHPKHDEDVYGWAIHTAKLLRNKEMNEVDFDTIIEEIEALGRSEKHELKNRLSLVISHLLKWQYQPNMRGHSWKYSIIEQRTQAKQCLKDSPSLKSQLKEILENAYDISISKAIRDTGLDESVFPSVCPYTFEQVMDNTFYPEA
ncbi:MAG: DUF29 family protein [Verrucomicrobia bacterium]|nr:DUF29 family protein [Verrucomicrobiota bacterium]